MYLLTQYSTLFILQFGTIQLDFRDREGFRENPYVGLSRSMTGPDAFAATHLFNDTTKWSITIKMSSIRIPWLLLVEDGLCYDVVN